MMVDIEVRYSRRYLPRSLLASNSAIAEYSDVHELCSSLQHRQMNCKALVALQSMGSKLSCLRHALQMLVLSLKWPTTEIKTANRREIL